MSEPVIIEAVRSPIGKREGTLSKTRPDEIYAQIVSEVLKRSGINPTLIEDVVTGCVTQVGEQGANIGRIATLLSNLPKEVPAVTLNRMCGSSQQAIHFVAQAVAAGDIDFGIAGGVESMSRVQMFSDIQGGFEKLNPLLFDKYEIVHQGESAERIADKWGFTREQLDDYSCESHAKAAKAMAAGYFQSQICPVAGLSLDEGVRAQLDRAKVGSLKTVFRPNGKITAANASQISDGVAAILIGSAEKAKALGLKARAKFKARVAVGGDPTMQLIEVIPATTKALKKAGLSLHDIDVFEVNEAFASVVMAWMKELKVDPAKVNPNGGAIAHGHPLGATGAVLMTKLINELERRKARYGLQVMCIGHGMATATIVEKI